MARISLDRLAHTYHPQPRGEADYALKRTSHVWEDGQACALLGPSGCGKTTLLNMISGLLRPSSGRVLFDDEDVTRMATAQRNIAQVFQFPVVYNSMSVRQNLAFPLRNRGMDRAAIRARVDQVAAMLGLEHVLARKARGLGADMQQKVSLGRGLVREDVRAILFDEPLTVIDPHLKRHLRMQLKALHREFGHTMIYVTHDQTEALGFADQVVVMHEGRIVQCAAPQTLLEAPAHRFVGYFIGSPGMNFFDVRVEGARAWLEGMCIPLGADYGVPRGRVQIGIRPEHVRLGPDGLPVRIERVEDLGRHSIVRARLAGQALNLIVPHEGPGEAQERHVCFDPDKISVFVDDWRLAPAGDGTGAA